MTLTEKSKPLPSTSTLMTDPNPNEFYWFITLYGYVTWSSQFYFNNLSEKHFNHSLCWMIRNLRSKMHRSIIVNYRRLVCKIPLLALGQARATIGYIVYKPEALLEKSRIFEWFSTPVQVMHFYVRYLGLKVEKPQGQARATLMYLEYKLCIR